MKSALRNFSASIKLIVLLHIVLVPIHLLFAQERADTTTIRHIKSKALQNSQVIDNVFFLSDVIGPRLTGSPAFRAAGDWIINLLHNYKLDNIQKEQLNWGRGWSYKKFGFYLMEPYIASLIASPGPLSSGTHGFINGEPFLAPAPTDILQDTYEKYVHDYKGKLEDKFVLISPHGLYNLS